MCNPESQKAIEALIARKLNDDDLTEEFWHLYRKHDQLVKAIRYNRTEELVAEREVVRDVLDWLINNP